MTISHHETEMGEELDDWGQKFGNMFAGFLGMFFVIATIMFSLGVKLVSRLRRRLRRIRLKKIARDQSHLEQR